MMQMTPIDAALARVRATWAPPPQFTVSEFSDRELVVTSGPLAGTRWQTSFAPYQRGILDAVHELGVQFVVVMGSSQFGKTACLVNVVSYYIAHDPCSILVVEPTVDPMAKDFAKNRLDPTIKASPCLSAVVDKKRQKDASNSVLLKTFRGGFLALAGSTSAASLAARSIRVLICDEIDRYEHTLKGEGDTLSVAIKRTTTFQSRRRVLLVSTPTVVGGPIETWFRRGDQRRYHVPCPSCGVMHPFLWKQVRWDRDDPATARIHCPACDYPISNAERVAILARGEWRPEPGVERADPSIVSFHLWEAYSPMSSLREIVAGFLRAREAQKAGDRAEMHTWENTTLGEPVEPDRGEGAEPHVLLMRREAYGDDVDCPESVCCLTVGIDTQDDRLEALVVGWAPGEESWFVHHERIDGDTSQADPWDRLAEFLDRPYRHALGGTLTFDALCIDTAGHRTTLAYEFVAKHAARRVYGIIGRDGQRPIISAPSPRRWGRGERQIPLYTIGTDAAKALIVSRLLLTEKTRGYVHLPMRDWCGDEFAAQLTSERLVTKFVKGVVVQEWRKFRARNEALDLSVYALGALRLLNPNLDGLAAQRRGAPPTDHPPPTPAQRPAPWIDTRRTDGWLKGRQ